MDYSKIATETSLVTLVEYQRMQNLYKMQISRIEKRLSMLLIVPSNSIALMDDEVESTKRFIKDKGYDNEVLLDDLMNFIEYRQEELDTFLNYVYEILQELRELSNHNK